MPISKKYNLGFIHIPKTGGSTIEKTLNMIDEECLYSNKPHPKWKINSQHFTFDILKDVVDVDLFKWFTIVRNPYHRMISEYHFITDNKDNKEAKEYYNLNFNDFVKMSLSLKKEERIYIFDNHLEPQHHFIDFNYHINIFKYEKIKTCFEWLISSTGEDLKFGWERKAANKQKFTAYFNSIETIKILNNFYSTDFELFNYKLLNH